MTIEHTLVLIISLVYLHEMRFEVPNDSVEVVRTVSVRGDAVQQLHTREYTATGA